MTVLERRSHARIGGDLDNPNVTLAALVSGVERKVGTIDATNPLKLSAGFQSADTSSINPPADAAYARFTVTPTNADPTAGTSSWRRARGSDAGGG